MDKFIVMFAAVAATVAAQAAAQEDAAGQSLGVYEDMRSTCLCVVGSLIGAFLTVAVFPPSNDSEENKVRRLSLKFGSSMLAGIAFTPMLMQEFRLPRTGDHLMGTAAAVAVFAVAGLHMLAPRVERLVEKLGGGK